MKRLIYTLLLFTFYSCDNGTVSQKNSGDRELVPNPEKYQHDNYSNADSLKPKFSPDTVIGQLSLLNSINVDTYLGKNIMDKLIKDEALPRAAVITKDKKQKLTVYILPGGGVKEFFQFQVEYNNTRLTSDHIINENEFVTENKIKLGISVGDLKSLKGDPDTIITSDKLIYHYKIDDFNHSDFLGRYNMPIYFADYVFDNGYLTEFKFGFEYP